MSDNVAEITVKLFLEHHGFCLERIKETESESCDYRASSGDESYLLEVKGRFDDQTFTKQLRKEGHALREKTTGRDEKIRKVVRKAMSQLAAIQPEPCDTFKVIWFFLDQSVNQELAFRQIRSTLYGTESIVYWPSEHSDAQSVECFYFGHSDFYSRRDLDAVMVDMTDGMVLCVNNHATRYDLLKRSALWAIFDERGILEPFRMEEQGDFFVADCEIDRDNPEEVLEYVRKKYGLIGNVFNAVFKEVSAAAVVKEHKR